MMKSYQITFMLLCLGLSLFMKGDLTAQTYAIIAKNSGLALDVPGGSRENVRIIQWTYEHADNQHFKFEALGNDVYVIYAVHSNKALTAHANENILYQFYYNNSTYQHFKILPAEKEGYFHIVNVENGKYLDVEGGSTETGANILLWDKHGGENQTFMLQALGGSPTFVCGQGRAPEPSEFYVNVLNKSMWDVSFRVKSDGSWSEWKYANTSANPKWVSVTTSGPIENYEIMWLDFNTWKYFGGTPVIPDAGDMDIKVSGNIFTGIKIN